MTHQADICDRESPSTGVRCRRLPPMRRVAQLGFAAGLAFVAACSGGSGESTPVPETTAYKTETTSRLSFDVGTGGTGPAPLAFALSSAPEGMLIDAQSGRVEWVAQADQIGEHAVEVTVTDRDAGTTSKSYRVEVTAPPDAAPYIVLRTESIAFTRSQPIRVSWRLGGEIPAGASIELGAEAPEVDGSAADGSPTSWTLGAQGTWSETPVKLQDAARLGQAALTLPNRVAGHWTITTRLLDAAGEALATSATRVLVADMPTLRLTLNRAIANPLDTVRIVADLAPGTTPPPTRLLAWLVQPDGRKLGLPSLDPTELEVLRGETDGGRYTLLERDFMADESGRYRVLVRLYATADGRLLQEASAGFEVCSSTDTLSGRVLMSDRRPVDGPALPQALVQAFDIDDGGVTEATPIASDGSYTLNLPAGRYLVTARAVDTAGATLEAEPAAVTVGCSAATRARDFQLRTR